MLKKILLFVFGGILFLPVCVRANVAAPVRRTLPLAGGGSIEATLTGDEFCHFYLTDDGKALCEKEDGTFRILSEFEVANMKENGKSRRNMMNERRIGRRKTVGVVNEPLLGKKKGLVILVEFYDFHFVQSNPGDLYKDFFNKENYSDFGMAGSVADYFRTQSYGQFEMEFDVVGPVTLEKSMAYYGQNNGESIDVNMGDLISESCKAIDSKVNFSDYDWDDDGECDLVFFVYAGYGESYGAQANTIWPHSNNASYLNLKLDNTTIGSYACSCELVGMSGKQIAGIGVACHEFSHCLGLPDFYDVDYKNYGMSYWDLMHSGDHINNSCTPIGYTSYERWFLGWMTPTEITSMTEIKNMKPLSEAPEAYILYNDGNRNEYYMIENRQRVGMDVGAYGHGMLVLHVFYDKKAWINNRVNSGDVQGMTYVAADGAYKGTAASLAADLFPGTKGVTALTEMTATPATVYNANKDGSYFLHKNIEYITESEDGLISFLALRPWLTAPQMNEPTDVTENTFGISWDAVEGATSYDLEFTEVPAAKDPSEAMLLCEDFKGCYKSSVGFSDISTNLNKYVSGAYSGSKLYQTPDLLRIGTSTTSGCLYSPVMNAPETQKVTIVVTFKPLKEGVETSGNVNIMTNTESTRQEFPFAISTTTTLVFNSYIPLNEIYRIDILPSSGIYIQYFALYDGEFSAADLGLENTRSVNHGPKTATMTRYETNLTSFTFSNLTQTSTYKLRVRAKDEERESLWTDEITIRLKGADGITVPFAAQNEKTDMWFDLSGRCVQKPTKSGVYIRDGKKIFVR